MIIDLIYAITAALSGVLFIVGIGALITHRKYIDKQYRSQLSGLVERVFLPSMIFTSFLKSTTLSQIYELIPCVVVTIVCIAAGYLLADFANKYWLKEKSVEQIVLLCCLNPHVTNITLQLIAELTIYFSITYSMSEKEVEGRMITTCMVQTVIANTVRWSLGRQLLMKSSEDMKQNDLELTNLETENNLLVKPENKESQKSCLNMPLISVMVALICLCVPPLQNVFVQDSFIHRAVFIPLVTVAKATTPSMLLLLGSNLYNIYSSSTKLHCSMNTIHTITVVRLILSPIVGVILLLLLKSFQIITDPCQLFILLVPFSTPPAINVLVMAKQYTTNTEDIVSVSLLYGYLGCMITLPIWMISFLSMI